MAYLRAIFIAGGVTALLLGPAAQAPASVRLAYPYSAAAAGLVPGSGQRPRAEMSTCAQVYFIGARGSDETGSKGLGPEVLKMESAIARVLSAHKITMKMMPDPYRADDPIADLKATAYEIALFASNPAAGAAYYYHHNVEKWLASLDEGISEAVLLAQGRHRLCPHSLLIMAGYSQGAMAMHQAELQLAADHDTGLLGQIAATLLLGDGDRIKNTAAQRYGSVKATAKGIRTWLGQNSGQDVYQPATTADICNAGDIVCDFAVARLTHFNAAVKVHESYLSSDLLTTAATWAAGLAVKRIEAPALAVKPSQGPPGTAVTGT